MLNLGKLIGTETGKYIMSVLLGLGLASLFRTICKDKNCVILYAPSLDEVEKKIFRHGDKCYSYHSRTIPCNPSKTSIPHETKFT